MRRDKKSTFGLISADRRTLVLMLVIFSAGFALRAGAIATVQGIYSESYSQPYMYDMDSYYNLRLASNLLEHGNLSEDGWDRYSYYPPGVPLDYPPLLAYVTILVYMILSPLTGLTDLAFWLPAFIAPLAGVLVFALARSLDCDELSSAAAGLLAVSVPFYFMRTVPGFYDTDMFNLVLPLAVVLSLQVSLKEGSWRYAVLGGVFMALYSTAWNGWQILYCLIVVAVILFRNLRRREPIILLLVSTALIEVLAPGSIISILSGALRIPGGVSSAYPFPNPYANITELQRPDLADAVIALGPGLLLAGITGFRALIRDHRKSVLLPLLSLWTVTGAVLMVWGIRFSEIAAVPLLVTSALFLSDIRRTEIRSLGSMNLSDPQFRRVFHVAVAAMVVLPSFLICIESYSALHPRVNDDLMAAADYIRENTSSGTVVICNWVHGHFFAFMAERPVNFDGRLAYIETLPRRGADYPLDPRVPGVYREYWQDRALATSDPVLSSEILSMLASSGDDAYLEVLKNENDPATSAIILGDVLGVKRGERVNYLMEKYGFHEDAAGRIASTLNRKSDYVLITYDRLIDKGYWILYYGSWNFTGKTEEPLYSTGTITSLEPLRSSDGLVCDGSVKFNGVNVSRLYLVNGTPGIIEGDPDSDIVAFALLGRNRTVVLQRRYEGSMFVRLVLLGDGGGVFRAVMRSGDVTVWEPIHEG
ncbi:STT3 domain-containing protein [Methanothermobacter sp.]|uniref:STT3 domain-containing protein n=1 Tax=Methanothermobacter sp. TaxID=1884223 RepID=UPI0026181465|nr:STT3 domain-containing protein [Methanothermobacter sp.]MDI9615497.1 STT3 domain-containing protein [Methanothermobacter sp.]